MLMVRVGDVHAWEPVPGILGAELVTPEWYILRTVPQREAAAKARLEKLGVLAAWFPTVTVTRRKPRALVMEERQRRVAPGYLFTRWGHVPQWHRLKERTSGWVSSVVCVCDRPWSISEAVIAKMALVPHRIEEMRQAEEMRLMAEERQRIADRLAMRPEPGHPARLLDGPLAGTVVAVLTIRAGVVTWEAEGFKGTAKVEAMERVA
jgi:transcription antitermination factor NusG